MPPSFAISKAKEIFRFWHLEYAAKKRRKKRLANTVKVKVKVAF